jgi:hypothetical protein
LFLPVLLLALGVLFPVSRPFSSRPYLFSVKGDHTMSAFIVRDVTINKIVSFLQLKAMGDPYYQPNRIVSSAGYAACNDGEAARLARDLFALNVRAVNHRYPENVYATSAAKEISPRLNCIS